MQIQNKPSFTGWYKITLPKNVNEEYGQKSCQTVFNTILDMAGEYQKGETRVLAGEPISFVNIKNSFDSVFRVAVNNYLNFVNEIFTASGIDKCSVKKIQPKDYEDIFQLQTSKSVTQLFSEEYEAQMKNMKNLEKEEEFKRLMTIHKKEYYS